MDFHANTTTQEADSQLNTLTTMRDRKKITWLDVFIYPVSIYIVRPDTDFSTHLVRSISEICCVYWLGLGHIKSFLEVTWIYQVKAQTILSYRGRSEFLNQMFTSSLLLFIYELNQVPQVGKKHQQNMTNWLAHILIFARRAPCRSTKLHTTTMRNWFLQPRNIKIVSLPRNSYTNTARPHHCSDLEKSSK